MRMARGTDARDVRAAILIPAYGQPWLTAETLYAAVGQRADFEFVVIVVNDGCSAPETHEICRNFTASYPGMVFYLKKANAGLSAARNTGIEFALSAFPALEAIYFLDCDNHIGPFLLQRMLGALRNSDETVGWAYTDVDKFGFASFNDTSGEYSPLEHLFRSFCEAGSMASRRMLDAGIRFDTAMRKGVEDWEFWLQGLEHGFYGVHVPNAGFRYRRRGESMLVEAERDFAPILSYIRSKHPRLYNVGTVLRLETDAQARYAIHHPDTGHVRLMTATSRSQLLPLNDYLVRLLRAADRPGYGLCPSHLIVLDQALYELLAEQRLLAGVLWVLECALMRATIACCSIRFHAGREVTFHWDGMSVNRTTTQPLPMPPEDAHIVAIEAGALLLNQFSDGGFANGNLPHAAKPFGGQSLSLTVEGFETVSTPRPVAQDFAVLRQRIDDVAARENRHVWRAADLDRHRAHAATPRHFYPELFNTPSVFPGGGLGRPVALVIDEAEPSALALAVRLSGKLRSKGWIPHLIFFGDRLTGDPEYLGAFAEIVSLPLRILRGGGEPFMRQAYLGTSLPLLDGWSRQAAIGTLAAYPLVISVQSALLHLIVGALRRLKVESWAFLAESQDRSRRETVTACAAFEQAYDAIYVETREMLHLCRALGIPPRRLHLWPEFDLAEASTPHSMLDEVRA
jgi:glycosyltransferase involved in cell wall biosynthesis